MKLSAKEKLMVMFLKQIGKRHPDGFIRAKSIRCEIADFLGCTTRTVSTVTRKLEAKGIIKVKLAVNNHEQSIYTILKEEI